MRDEDVHARFKDKLLPGVLNESSRALIKAELTQLLKEPATTLATLPEAADVDPAGLQPSQLSTPEAVDVSPPAPDRVESTTYRILRDTAKAIDVKRLHEYRCQICGHTIELSDGNRYAEAHHIQPLGGPHNGPDETNNILCVCPNHHAELDYGVRRITVSALHSAKGHVVEPKYVDYHNRVVYRTDGE